MSSLFAFPSGLELVRYTEELADRLVGSFIQKVYHEPGGVVSFKTYRRGWCGWCVFSARPELPCLYVAADRPHAGGSGRVREPPGFCRILRREAEGGRVETVTQVGQDRVIRLGVGGRVGERALVFEILGRFANLVILTSDGRIEACLREEPKRGIRAKGLYVPPKDRGKAPFDSAAASAVLEELWVGESPTGRGADRGRLAREMCVRVAGISPRVAAECFHRVAGAHESPGEVLRGVVREARDGSGPVWVYTSAEGATVMATPIRMTHLEESSGLERSEAGSFVEGLGAWYEDAARREELERLRTALLRRCRERRRRLERDLAAAGSDLAEGAREGEFRLAGEMILAQLQRVPRKAPQAVLENLYQTGPRELRVALDPALSPQENANRYFERAGRARRKSEQAAARKSALEGDLSRVVEIESEIRSAGSVEELEGAGEPRGGGPGAWPRQAGRGKRSQKPDALHRAARVYPTADGHTVLVARGAREGEEVLRRFARGGDLWLHTRDVPGAHVILRKPGKEETVPGEALLDAAHLAAHFSKARSEKVVPLHATEVKNLRRAPSGPPGRVVITRDRTFSVRVDRDRLRRLLASKEGE